MRTLRRRFDRISAFALIAAMLPFTASAAPKTVNPETIHRKIVERGTGRWICVDLKNGTAVVGRIASFGAQSFAMQLDNYPETTNIAYPDVQRVRRAGVGGKGIAVAIGAGVAGTVAFAIMAQHEMNNFRNNQPAMPTVPTAR
jgi:hypothetical protein